MGFIETFSRNKNTKISTIFSKGTTPILSSSIQTMGGVYVVLGAKLIQGIVPIRLRLYSDQQSMIIDGPRTTASFAVSESVALIADIVLRDTNTLTFDPPVIANTADGGLTWYNLQSVDNVPLAAAVSLTTYALNDIGDSQENKQAVNISGSQIPVTGGSIYGVSGSITTPKSFLILSGSATSESRLRLYSSPYTDIPLSEKTRSFDTAPQSGSLLIADLIFDSGSFQYPLVPVLEGYTWINQNYMVGTNEVGYILQNLSAGTTDITASLFIYSLED